MSDFFDDYGAEIRAASKKELLDYVITQLEDRLQEIEAHHIEDMEVARQLIQDIIAIRDELTSAEEPA